MIQVGTQDVLGRASLDMGMFMGNKSLTGVDITDLGDIYQEYVGSRPM
jgi:hypothetical protein